MNPILKFNYLPVNGAVASSNPIIPRDVKQAEPNWFFFNARGLMLTPKKWNKKLDALIKIVTKKAGKNLATPVRFLCSPSPLSFLMLLPWPLMKSAIS